jgi:hypothetical protein
MNAEKGVLPDDPVFLRMVIVGAKERPEPRNFICRRD